LHHAEAQRPDARPKLVRSGLRPLGYPSRRCTNTL
jgi:hypothetical protein